MNKRQEQNSLYNKISRIHYLIIAVLLLLGTASFSDLLYLERQIEQGNVISLFEEEILEIRREEKNLFLYRSEQSLPAILNYLTKATFQLEQHQEAFRQLPNGEQFTTLRQLLVLYQQTIQSWPEVNEDEVRSVGHNMTTIAEEFSAEEREALTHATEEAQGFLLLVLLLMSIVVFILSFRVRSYVIAPLQRLDQDLHLLAQNKIDSLPAPSSDREFVIFTERFNQTLAELEQSRKRSQQSEKLASLGNLAAGVAHELNNPLSNISTSCQLLMEESEEGDPEQSRKWLKQIKDETERGRLIIQTLLDYGSQRGHTLSAHSLEETFNETLRILNKRMDQAKALLTLNISEEITVMADKPRLQQVFINLIENALDAGATQLQLSASRVRCGMDMLPENAEIAGNLDCSGDEAVEILLSDNGTGIPKELMPQLFEPFFTGKQPGEGTGLGLYIIHEIIQDHNGCIAINSTQKQGTRVTLLLPLESTDG